MTDLWFDQAKFVEPEWVDIGHDHDVAWAWGNRWDYPTDDGRLRGPADLTLIGVRVRHWHGDQQVHGSYLFIAEPDRSALELPDYREYDDIERYFEDHEAVMALRPKEVPTPRLTTQPTYTLESKDPLTITEVIVCMADDCNDTGRIVEGEWVAS